MGIPEGKVRYGEPFIEDGSNRIEQIFDYLRQDDPSLTADGRYASFDGPVVVRGESVNTVARFAAKDFPQEEVLRKAVITAFIKYDDFSKRFVKTTISNMSNGTTILEVEDTLTSPSFGQPPRDIIQTARLKKESNSWKIEDVSDTLKEGQKESSSVHLIPTNVIAGSVLGHAFQALEALNEFFRIDIVNQVSRERTAKEKIVEFLG